MEDKNIDNNNTTQPKKEDISTANTSHKKVKVVDVELSLAPSAIRWEKRDIKLTRKTPSFKVKSNDPVLTEIIYRGTRGYVDKDILINGKPVIYYINKLISKDIPEKIHVKLNDNVSYMRIGDVTLSRLSGKIDHVFNRNDENINIVLKALLLRQLVIVKNKDDISESNMQIDAEEFIVIEKMKSEIIGIINDIFITKEPADLALTRLFENYKELPDLYMFIYDAIESEYHRAIDRTNKEDEKEINEINRVYNMYVKAIEAFK